MFNKKLIKEYKDKMKIVYTIVLLQWLALLSNVLFIYNIIKVLNKIYLKDFNNLSNTFILLILLIIIRSIFNYFADINSVNISEEIKYDLRLKTINKLFELGYDYHQIYSKSTMTQIISEGVEQLEIYFSKYIPQVFYSLLSPITLFLIISRYSFKSAIVLILFIPLIPLSIIFVQKIAKKLLKNYWHNYTIIGNSFLENLEGITTLKIYNRQDKYLKKMDQEAESFRKATMKVLIMQLNSISIMDLVAYGGAGIGMIVTIFEYLNGNISFFDSLFVILIAFEYFLPLRMLGSYFHIAQNGNEASNKIFKLLETKVDNRGNDINNIKELQVSNLSFKYDNQLVLNNISFKIAKPGLYGIVGLSGCGKSTLSKAISSRFNSYAGDIYYNQQNLRTINSESLYQKIKIINHNEFFFKGTIKDNLLIANKEASDQLLYDTLQQVALKDTLMQKEGLETLIESGATNLSGGQRQRLALARAILSNNDFYIFDEATSNIDSESEKKILEVIKKMSKTKIIIMISHYLDNVKDANNIMVLDNGCISETGTFEQLLDAKNHFYNLYNQQLNYQGEL